MSTSSPASAAIVEALVQLLPSEGTKGERQGHLCRDPTPSFLFPVLQCMEMVGALEPPIPALAWASECFAGQAGCQLGVVMQGVHRGWRLKILTQRSSTYLSSKHLASFSMSVQARLKRYLCWEMQVSTYLEYPSAMYLAPHDC